ncbi:MAG TPA: hypothetical protein IAC21_03680 [Candidatus Enterenecus merdae]|nr:hypothetical protein [Candidatus Enterenecus merdae]
MLYCKHCGAPLEEGQHCPCPAAQAERAALGGALAPEDPQPAPSNQDGPVPEPEAQAPTPDAGQGQNDGQASSPDGGQGQSAGAPQWGSATTTTHSGPVTPPPGAGQPSRFTLTLKNLLPFLKAYWHNPAQATRSAVGQKDWLLAALLFGAQAVAAILAVLSILLKFRQAISSLFGLMMGGFGLLGDFELSTALSIPYGLVATVLGCALMVLMIFALAKLFKSPASFQAAFIACGVNTLPVTALLLLTFLVGLVSLGMGLGLLAMVLPAFAVSGLIPARQLCPDQERGAFQAAYLIGVILVTAITYFLCVAILF